MLKTFFAIVTFTAILVPLPMYGEGSLVDLAIREVRGNRNFEDGAMVTLLKGVDLVIEKKCGEVLGDPSSKGDVMQAIKDLTALGASDTSLNDAEKKEAEDLSITENVNGSQPPNSQTTETILAGPSTSGNANPLQPPPNSPTDLTLPETENRLADEVDTRSGETERQQTSASNNPDTTNRTDTALGAVSNTKLKGVKVQRSALLLLGKVIEAIKKIVLSIYQWCRELGRKVVAVVYGVIHLDYLERLSRDQYKQVLLQFAQDMDGQAFKTFLGEMYLDPAFAIGLSKDAFTACFASLTFAEMPWNLLPSANKLASIATKQGCNDLATSVTTMAKDMGGYLASSLINIGTAVGKSAVTAAVSGSKLVGNSFRRLITSSPTPEPPSGSAGPNQDFVPVEGLYYQTLQKAMKGLEMPNNLNMKLVLNSYEAGCRFDPPTQNTDKPFTTTPSNTSNADNGTTREANASRLSTVSSQLFQRDTKGARSELMKFISDNYYDISRKISLISLENSTVKLIELVPVEAATSLLRPALAAMTVPVAFRVIWKCVVAIIMKVALLHPAVILTMPSHLLSSIDPKFLESVAELAQEKFTNVAGILKNRLTKANVLGFASGISAHLKKFVGKGKALGDSILDK